MMKRFLRTALIMIMTGTFVSATQAALAMPGKTEAEGSGETCFAETGMLDLSGLAGHSSAILSSTASLSTAAARDTLETYEIELEDEGKKGVNYKAIAGFTIAAVLVGYMLYIMLVPEEEETKVEPPGKEPPITLITIPFGE